MPKKPEGVSVNMLSPLKSKLSFIYHQHDRKSSLHVISGTSCTMRSPWQESPKMVIWHVYRVNSGFFSMKEVGPTDSQLCQSLFWWHHQVYTLWMSLSLANLINVHQSVMSNWSLLQMNLCCSLMTKGVLQIAWGHSLQPLGRWQPSAKAGPWNRFGVNLVWGENWGQRVALDLAETVVFQNLKQDQQCCYTTPKGSAYRFVSKRNIPETL